MPSMLYLDAARMGRMAPTAQLALREFVRVAGEEGCTLYFEKFLRDGFSAWPSHLQSRYPGLRSWAGISELKAALAEFADLPSDSPPLLAGRSANLSKLAARQLFRNGGTVLVTDLTWPSYADILQRTALKAKGQIEYLRIRARILRREISLPQLIETEWLEKDLFRQFGRLSDPKSRGRCESLIVWAKAAPANLPKPEVCDEPTGQQHAHVDDLARENGVLAQKNAELRRQIEFLRNAASTRSQRLGTSIILVLVTALLTAALVYTAVVNSGLP